jgi:hypothetical protein
LLAYRVGLRPDTLLADFLQLMNPTPVIANGFEAAFFGGAGFARLPFTFFFPFAALAQSAQAKGFGSFLVQDVIPAAPLRELFDDQGYGYQNGDEATFGKEVLVVGRKGELFQRLPVDRLPEWLQSKMREGQDDGKARGTRAWSGVELEMLVDDLRDDIFAKEMIASERDITRKECVDLASFFKEELLVPVPKSKGFVLGQLLELAVWFETVDEFKDRLSEITNMRVEQLRAARALFAEGGPGKTPPEAPRLGGPDTGDTGDAPPGRAGFSELNTGERPAERPSLGGVGTGGRPNGRTGICKCRPGAGCA